MASTSPQLNVSQNVVSTAGPQAGIVTSAQPSAHSHRHLWARFIDSFKPPDGSDPLNDAIDPSYGPEAPRSRSPSDGSKDSEGAAKVQVNVAEGGNVEKGLGFGGEVVTDGDMSHEPDGLKRDLRGRHLQMIVLGGAVGSGLFIATGGALASGGPGSVFIGFLLSGMMLFTVVNALGELAVVFPVQGSFAIYSTRFIHPAWGFAMGWNYALPWLASLPFELTAASITIQYWDPKKHISPAVWITIFWFITVLINFFGVRGFGEAEFVYSAIKVITILAFIIFGIVVNVGGGPTHHYYGAHTWYDPGAFANGFKGFCSVFVTVFLAFSGTELVGLAAAETKDPRHALPLATKQLFWRVTLFYIISLLLVGFIVPYNNPNLLNGSGATASPFVIAISTAGVHGLPSVFNTVILIAALSIGNSSIYAASRTLTALAHAGQAPKIFKYIDRAGRPLASVVLALLCGLIAYVGVTSAESTVFDWMLALGGLTTIFTWGSICLAHIRFRKAWARAGKTVEELPFAAPLGVYGSWFGFWFNVLILIATFYVALFPIRGKPSAQGFFQQYLAAPVAIALFIGRWLYKRESWVRIEDIDIDSGRRDFPPLEVLRRERAEIAAKSLVPRILGYLC